MILRLVILSLFLVNSLQYAECIRSTEALDILTTTEPSESLNNFHRIVGGFQINITDAPYQISIQFPDEHECGGAIISKRFVITAAHCVHHTIDEPQDIRVVLGQTEALHTNNTYGEVFEVEKIIEHEKFNRSSLDYDMALLRLKKSIKYSSTKRYVKLAKKTDKISEGTLCMVSGWGITYDSTKDVNLLRATMVPYISRKRCRVLYPGGDITNRMICAGYDEGGKDSCTMDSGGPLLCNGKLFGIVSWGHKCAQPDKPGVYTLVNVLQTWLDKKMKEYIKIKV